MFIKAFPKWPKDLAISNWENEFIEDNDNHWEFMERSPDYINSDMIQNLVYEQGNTYFKASGKYEKYYFLLAFVTWSKAPVIISMHKTRKKVVRAMEKLAKKIN